MSLKFLSLKYCCNNEQIGPNTLSYIHLATCGIPISHHILHILVRLLILHVSASISQTDKRTETRQPPLEMVSFFLSCHVNNSILRFAAIRLVFQYWVTCVSISLISFPPDPHVSATPMLSQFVITTVRNCMALSAKTY